MGWLSCRAHRDVLLHAVHDASVLISLLLTHCAILDALHIGPRSGGIGSLVCRRLRRSTFQGLPTI